jgi:hypothetical protein
MKPLQQVLTELKNRAIQEQILGKPLPNERVANDTEKQIEPTDWARVVQTNLTRLGAVAIMFFLVGILVPQYRYNIRMSSFYDARADFGAVSTLVVDHDPQGRRAIGDRAGKKSANACTTRCRGREVDVGMGWLCGLLGFGRLRQRQALRGFRI